MHRRDACCLAFSSEVIRYLDHQALVSAGHDDVCNWCLVVCGQHPCNLLAEACSTTLNPTSR
eukprot:8987396-Pyramimonas_sp.AAC.2